MNKGYHGDSEEIIRGIRLAGKACACTISTIGVNVTKTRTMAPLEASIHGKVHIV